MPVQIPATTRRLTNQKLLKPVAGNPQKIVRWLGAVQAQDLPMALWAIGIRMKTPSERAVRTALDKGQLLRTHVLRPTWHIVAPEDIRWMLSLTAPHILRSTKSRHRQLGLTPAFTRKCLDILARELEGGRFKTRQQLVKALENAGLNIHGDNRPAHILMLAELEQVICSGPLLKNNQTYALLDDRVPEHKVLSQEEAQYKLAHTYFRSHGPATIRDFIWWSGLPVRQGREAVDSLQSVTKSGDLLWQKDKLREAGDQSTILLPAYDEYIIAYADRSPILRPGHIPKTISNNGIFRPVILDRGVAVGIWSRSIEKETLLVTLQYFQKPSGDLKSRVEAAAEKLERLTGMRCTTRHSVL